MPPKGSKAAHNSAPWWWEPAICECWALGGKDRRRDKVYTEAVQALDAVYGGEGQARVGRYAHWGSASEPKSTPLRFDYVGVTAIAN
jgi:hypothetical protein